MRARGYGVVYCLVLGAVVLSLMGCTNNAQRMPQNRHFGLEVKREGPPRTRNEGVLRVRTFRVAEPFATDQLVYRVGESLFEIDYYKQFVAPPEAMLTQEARRWLAAAGLFADVVDPSSRADISHTLEAHVGAMYGDYSAVNTPQAVLEMQFILVHETPGRNRVVFDKMYRARTPVSSTKAEDLIQSLNQSLHEVLTNLEADLDRRWTDLHATPH